MATERTKMIDTLGLKPIHLATIRNQKGKVCRLLGSGTNVDEKTRHGITALMLGALFGHLEMVRFLIKHGADRKIRDAENKRAKDYSWSSSNLVMLRWGILETISEKLRGRCQAPNVLYRRKRIWKILRRRDTFQGFLQGALQPHGESCFSISAVGEVSLWKKVTTVNNGSGRNDITPAIMARTEKLTFLQWAFSGWTTGDIGPKAINSQQYTQLVMAFCASTGFVLRPNARDRPSGRTMEKGQWEACHAEKKLGVWYLRLLMTITFKDKFKDPLECGYGFNQEQLNRFKSMKIPTSRRTAYIFLGHDPCTGCLDFLAHIKKVSGLEILVTPIPVMKEYQRPNKSYSDPAADEAGWQHASDSDGNDDDDNQIISDNDSQTSSQKTPEIPAGDGNENIIFTHRGSPQRPGISETNPDWGPTQKPVATPIFHLPEHLQRDIPSDQPAFACMSGCRACR